MLRVSQIRLKPDHTPEELKNAIVRKLRIRDGSRLSFRIVRQSIDARKKPDIFYVYTADVEAEGEAKILKRLGRDRDIVRMEEKPYRVPEHGSLMMRERPVIIGSGPAGLFCALLLAREGYRPLVIERGEMVEQRVGTVQKFWDTNELNTDSNVQFGEGGAGTFSDGKLNTSIKDPAGRIRFVLQTFVEAGADEDILYSYKPHIGTDRLRGVIAGIRGEIISLGGTFLFGHRLEELSIRDEMPAAAAEKEAPFTNDRADVSRYCLSVRDLSAGVMIRIRTDTVVLALGHSARDTFGMLLDKGMYMEPKAFAVGVRVQHPQRIVDEAMYGKDCPFAMPPSPYKLTCQLEAGGVYSFCMCPGGWVVNASSEPGMIAVNGMSLRDRDSGNANAAIVMTVRPDQYVRYMNEWGDGNGVCSETDIHPLAGMHFTRMLERRAWKAGDGCIPAERFSDFCIQKENGKTAETGSKDRAIGEQPAFQPCIKGKYVPADVRSIFPEEIGDALEEGIRRFDRVIPGFASGDTLLCAPESRTSSPVRISRDPDSLESVTHPGVYPCGEGAGYAGGITSAAVDGMRVAEALIRKYKIPLNPEGLN